MDVGRVGSIERDRGLDGHILIRSHLTVRRDVELQGLTQHDAVVGHALLALLVLVFLPVLEFLLGILEALGIRCLGNERQGVGLLPQHPCRVGDVMKERYLKGILIDQRRIAQPVGDGVALSVGLCDESVVAVEVETSDDGQDAVAIAVEECEVVGLGAVALHEVAVGENLVEGSQTDVVGKEMGVAHPLHGGDVQGVGPRGILTDILLEGRLDEVVVEGQHLTLLIEAVVAVCILQSIDMVFAGSHTFYDKVAVSIGARYAQHGFGLESRVGKVAVEAHKDAFDRLQVRSLHDIARHLQRVDMVAGGEGIGIVAQGIALVVVADGIGEVDGVGGVGFQGVLQSHRDALALSFYLRCLYLRRRDDDILGGVVDGDVFVEVDDNLLLFDIGSPLGRLSADDMGRGLIIPSPVGTAHTGTGVEKQHGDDDSRHTDHAVDDISCRCEWLHILLMFLTGQRGTKRSSPTVLPYSFWNCSVVAPYAVRRACPSTSTTPQRGVGEPSPLPSAGE